MRRGDSRAAIGSAPPRGRDALSIGVRAALDTELDQPAAEGPTRDAEILRKAQLALAGEIVADEILSVRRLPFRGQVYGLETRDGWYMAGKLLIKNCECDIDMTADFGPLSLPDWAQSAVDAGEM